MQEKANYIKCQMIQKIQEHTWLSKKVYMCIVQIPAILYTSYVYYRFKMELVESRGHDENSLWSDSESQLGKIREPISDPRSAARSEG